MHSIGRVGTGFDIMEVAFEIRALHARVLHLWRAGLPRSNVSDLDDIARFYEVIDQSVAKSVGGYTRRMEEPWPNRRRPNAARWHNVHRPPSVGGR